MASEGGTLLVGTLLKEGAARLLGGGVDSPDLTARFLLGHIMGLGVGNLSIISSEVVDEKVAGNFRNMVERRFKGEPTQYITGEAEFWSLDFEVNPSVLIPRPETELLVELTLKEVKRLVEAGITRNLKILDLCTGSGCVAVALASELTKRGACEGGFTITATDTSAEALEVAGRNCRAGGPEGGVAGKVKLLRGDLFEALTQSDSDSSSEADIFDIIVANPPYVDPEVEDTLQREISYEPREALFCGGGGLDVIRRIIADSPGFLVPGGVLLMEIGFDQGGPVREILESSGNYKGVEIFKDLSGNDRVVRALLA